MMEAVTEMMPSVPPASPTTAKEKSPMIPA